ncbi:hypothetical protein [Endozoicomonas sp. Mp262]|uniref:hypothetical protein n=1 Tax=Endozoicomonas sp. Mp262 TaxID=2919499 RepID=UPI0021D871CB
MMHEIPVSGSPKPYIEPDPVTEMLRGQGNEVYNHYLAGTSIVIGGRIQWVDCELVYRVEPADTLIIVLFQRLHERAGLKNSFRDLVRFCDFIAGHVPEINTVTGTTIPTLTAAEGGIAAERLLAMYRRYIAMELRDGCVYFDLKRYREKKRRYTADYSWITKVVNGSL